METLGGDEARKWGLWDGISVLMREPGGSPLAASPREDPGRDAVVDQEVGSRQTPSLLGSDVRRPASERSGRKVSASGAAPSVPFLYSSHHRTGHQAYKGEQRRSPIGPNPKTHGSGSSALV